MYLLWFDDRPKVPVEEKIAGALAAYRARYAMDATIVLCHPEQQVVNKSVLVVTGESQGIPVQRNNFLIGQG